MVGTFGRGLCGEHPDGLHLIHPSRGLLQTCCWHFPVALVLHALAQECLKWLADWWGNHNLGTATGVDAGVTKDSSPSSSTFLVLPLPQGTVAALDPAALATSAAAPDPVDTVLVLAVANAELAADAVSLPQAAVGAVVVAATAHVVAADASAVAAVADVVAAAVNAISLPQAPAGTEAPAVGAAAVAVAAVANVVEAAVEVGTTKPSKSGASHHGRRHCRSADAPLWRRTMKPLHWRSRPCSARKQQREQKPSGGEGEHSPTHIQPP